MLPTTMRTCYLLLTLVVVYCNAQSKIGFYQILPHIGNFQAPSGGFRDAASFETADATSSGLLLSSLYGLNNKVNTVEATNFLNSLQNKDGGYGRQKGSPSDIQSTRNAILGLTSIGGKVPNPENTAVYLRSTLDKDTGLFGNRVGDKGSLRASAFTLQTYALIGQKVPADVVSSIKDALKRVPATFGEEVSEIYYGVLAASLVEYDIPKAKIAKTLVDLQSPQGLFYTDTAKRTTSITATADALLALRIIGEADSVNTALLRSAVRYIPPNIESAAAAHVALAVTKSFREGFQIQTGTSGKDIIEGASVRPAVTIFAKEGGVAHGGFDISSKHTFHGKQATQSKLTWNQDTQSYAGESLSSSSNFGPFNSVYTLSMKVPGIGPISFDVADTRHVGYGIAVNSKATIELSGRDVKENEQVTFGTDFTFQVALNSNANPKLVSGEFVATCSVKDSSDVIIHQSTVDGASNKEPVVFSYKLSNPDIPSGKLSFTFDVASRAGTVHTTHTVTYYITVAMVASNINFDQKPNSYKIGDTVKLSFEPATFADLRTPNVISSKNYKGEDVSASRHFFLDIKSPQGVLLHSTEGEATKSSRYAFSVPIKATFAAIGNNVLSFRYRPASGEDIQLQNFDSSAGELYEDVNGLAFNVKADLELVDVRGKPTASNFVYGDNIAFQFRVRDAVSGKYLSGSSDSSANVYLELQHTADKGSHAVTSVNIPAQSTKDQIVANWTINPNAHRGKGLLTLSVQDSDGKKIALKDAVSLTVAIAGDLQTKHQVLTTSPIESTSTSFIVEVDLFCKDKPLKDAQLVANVIYGDNVLATLPVAHNDGHYTVSWSAPPKDAKSGTYKVNFIREVDRQLALDQRDLKQKEERKARVLRGESDFNIESGTTDVEPIFTVLIPHTAPRFTHLPVKAELAALLIFGSIVVWLINKRSSLK